MFYNCRSITEKFEASAVKLTITQQNAQPTRRAETKKRMEENIKYELKEIVRNDLIAYSTNPESDFLQHEMPNDALLMQEIRKRLHSVHFAKFLSYHVACLLKNPEDAKKFFSDRKNIEYDIIKKGVEKKQKRKVTIDQYRKKFIFMFNREFLMDILQKAKSYLKFRFRRNVLTQKEKDGGESDGEEEQMEDFDVNHPQISSEVNTHFVKENVPTPLPALAASYNVICPAASDHGTFIQIYGSYIYKPQEIYVKKMIEKTELIQDMIESVMENDILNSISVEVKHLKTLIYQMVTETFLAKLGEKRLKFNTLIIVAETFLAKLGETREKSSSWQGRKNTFNIQPNHVIFDVVNIEATGANAKKLEAYLFAFMTHKGYKLSSRSSRSAAGEFFKLFCVSDDGVLQNMHHTITEGNTCKV